MMKTVGAGETSGSALAPLAVPVHDVLTDGRCNDET
jgi:hypothetical protein